MCPGGYDVSLCSVTENVDKSAVSVHQEQVAAVQYRTADPRIYELFSPIFENILDTRC